MSAAFASPDWLARLAEGDRRVLARAITAVENDTADAPTVMRGIAPLLGRARVVGITGPPGAGKSTLVSAMTAEYRRRARRVGVVAVDPSSPITGGAILGDRVRMDAHTQDPGVFVRSLASRGHLGGLSPTTARVVDVLDAAGTERIIVETVGAGQADVEIAELAQTRVVVGAPGLGDDIQAMKAGILEIADVLVVNKGDLSHARRTMGQLEGAVALMRREGWRPPVLRTVATKQEGIAELVDAIEAHGDQLGEDARRAAPAARMRQVLAGRSAERLKSFVRAGGSDEIGALVARLLAGEIGLDEAVERAIAAAARALEKKA